VEPYVPGEQPQRKVIKLNTNENPYPPAPGVRNALMGMDVDKMRLYPDPTSGNLVHTLAEYYGVKDEQVFVGVGSDDVLAMCFLTFFNSDKPILFPDITYSFYKVWAELYRIPYVCPKVDDNFHIVKEDYYVENGGIIFANPNAPTSIYEDLDFVEDIVKHNQDVIVIVDEAYVDFAGKSAIELVDKYDNLLVVQTFSKARSMAGMRIGYAIGNPLLIKYLNDAKYSFNSYTMNQTSLVSGVEAVKDKAYFEEQVQKIVDTREWVKKELTKLGFTYPDSRSNFIFVTHEKYAAKDLFEALKKADIYVRFLSGERTQNFLRITIGTNEEMEQLIAFLKSYMQA
jgi:histidinol-phosphate aminotransferase